MFIKAVFFDVDFTLIYPGPMFRAEGYQAFCARHAIEVDPSRFDEAVASAGASLNGPEDSPYDEGIWLAYTRHIIEGMGGRGPNVAPCAREIYDEWAACQHFELYEEVPAVLRELSAASIRIGLISNSHRCLASFQTHFELHGLISAAVSSAEHGFMKPHPSIFQAALQRAGVAAHESVMVGDSLKEDVEGALRAGMRAIWLYRGAAPPTSPGGVPVITSLVELPELLSSVF